MAKILIVDDDPDHLALAQAVLASEHEIETVGSGAEALSRLRAGGIDAVVLDLMMPGMSGLDLAAGLREERCVSGVPIVIWTACRVTDELEKRLSEAVNIHSVLPKPCEPSAITRVVGHMVGAGPQRRGRGDFGVHSFGKARLS